MASFKPTCPNHGAVLDGLPRTLPDKGVGMCPVSGVEFEYRAETTSAKVMVDAHGNPHKVHEFTVTGND